jgi:FtsP/CotA-like multicopper oxidase with cupredoxin domain
MDGTRRTAAEITRRHALKLGAAGAAGAGLSLAFVTNAFGTDLLGRTVRGPSSLNAAPQPPVQFIQSQNGVLQGTLVIDEGDAWIAGDTASGLWTYNGSYPGPLLWAKPGDRVLLDVTNNLGEMTNTHFHGFHVTPSGAGDNVFAHVQPGETFHHDFVIPPDHPGGLYWYHPHMHGLTDKQLYNGMAGLFVIEGGAATLPGLVDKTHVLLALKNTLVTGTAPNRALQPEPAASGSMQTINGDLLAALALAPGETQLWRIANIGNDAYYDLSLDGHTFTVVAEDGHLLWDTYDTTELFMPPGKRLEVAVTGGAAGSYSLRQNGYTQGPFGQWPAQVMADVTVSGPAQTPATVPAHPAPRVDLANEPIAHRRTVVMSESFDSSTNTPYFYMNGVLFQDITPGDVVQVTLGTTEEWVIRNDPSTAAGGTSEDHPFHLHINHMVHIGGGTWEPSTGMATSFVPVDPKGAADTINVKSGEYVLVRVRFTDYTGLTVFHCHITFHEDMGMMGEVNINAAVAPPDPVVPTPVAVTPTFTG